MCTNSDYTKIEFDRQRKYYIATHLDPAKLVPLYTEEWVENLDAYNYGSPKEGKHLSVFSYGHNPSEPLIIDRSLLKDLQSAMHPLSDNLRADGHFERWLSDELDQLVYGILDLYLSARGLMDELIYRHSYIVAECIQFIQFLRKAKADSDWHSQFENFREQRVAWWSDRLGTALK